MTPDNVPSQRLQAAISEAGGGDYTEAADSELLRRLREKEDIRAFEVLFARYEKRIQGWAAPYLPSSDLARDVSQEVFLKLLNDTPAELKGDSLAPWLRRVTCNLSIDYARPRRFEVSGESLPGLGGQTETTPQTELSASNDAQVLHQLVAQLPQELRTVVEFRLNQDLPFREIAERCGIPLGTALWRMHRAIEVLREQWQ